MFTRRPFTSMWPWRTICRDCLKVVAELVFQGEIHALGLLLFPELQAVAHDFGFAVLAMLAGSEVALFHGALVSKTLGPFQEQFHAFATAKAAYCTFITCHYFSSSSDNRFTGWLPFLPDP